MEMEWISWALSVVLACGLVAVAASFILDSTPPRDGRNAPRNAMLRSLGSAGAAGVAGAVMYAINGAEAFDMAAEGFNTVLVMGGVGTVLCAVLVSIAANMSRSGGRLMTFMVMFAVAGCAAILHFAFTVHPALPAVVALLVGALTFMKVSRDRAQQRRMQEVYENAGATKQE